jgi:hypothetical protein
MRIFTAAIVIGPLLLIGALPAGAGQSPPALGSNAPVGLAAGGDTAADRDTYTQKARNEMQEWRRKLHDFSEKAGASGKEAGNAAMTDLNRAWVKTEAASRKLQTVGADGWDHAKTSFEQASQALGTRFDPRTSKAGSSGLRRSSSYELPSVEVDHGHGCATAPCKCHARQVGRCRNG